MALQATKDKYLLYDSQTAQAQEHSTLHEGNPLWFWNDRLILVQHDNNDKHWRFTALDLITNETRSFYFSKSDNRFFYVKVISLSKDYGFIIESDGNFFCVNLVKLEWSSQKFQLIEKLNREYQFSGVLVNNLSPSKVVLRFRIDDGPLVYQDCSLDSGKIKLGSIYELGSYFEHYFENKLFVLSVDTKIRIYDWTTKKKQTIELEEFAGGYVDGGRIEWVKERLYASVFSYSTGNCGIVYANLETKRWISLDLVTGLRISKFQYFDGTLIVYATGNGEENDIYNKFGNLIDSSYYSVFEVHSIPVRHPQKLRKLAWPLFVNMMNDEEGVTDPYKAASRYLPFNTDLRPKWSLDKVDLEKPASDKQDQDEQRVTKAIEDKASENTLDQEQASTNSSQESIEGTIPSKRQKMD